MKVLHVDAEMLWRGGQQQAVYLYEGMLAKGFACSFVCRPHSKLQEYFVKQGMPHYALDFRGEVDLPAACNLAKVTKQGSYDILHLHSSHALSWGLLAKLFQSELKLVAARRVDFPIGKNPVSAYKYKSKTLKAIIAISDNIAKVLEDCGVPESKITVIHSGVDVHRFDNIHVDGQFRKQWHIPEGSILVGTVAAFAGHKDYPNFIKAAALAAQENSQLHFMAVGNGALFARMKAYAAELGLASRISFTGYQSDVGIFLKAMDIFVLASKLEGLGTSVLDAMAVGLPVIGTDAGGIKEMIMSGNNGLLVPAGNAYALAQAILELAASPEQRKIYGVKALESVNSFSKEFMINKTMELYGKL